MKYKKITCKNYDIYLVKTTKFKTINISTLLTSDYNKEDITKEKFISEFLINSNINFNNEVLMSKKYMSLYEPRISISDIFNDKQHKLFELTFLNEKYTEKGMMKETIDFYYDIIFKPNIKNNGFEKKNFDIIKSKMNMWYKMDEEDSGSMAYFNSMKYISDDLPIKYDTRGNKDELNKIDRKEILTYYNNKLNKSKFTIFVVGDYEEEIVDVIKNNLDDKVNKNEYKLKKTYDVTKVKKQREIIEGKDFNQSIVYIIYKIINSTEREREYVLPLLNNILGGSSSKLFNNVREKNSLAYYAYSSYFKSSNILYMYAGISKENYKKCVNLMKKELKEIELGNITDEELNDAFSSLKASILKREDSITSISNILKGNIIYGYPFYDEMLKEYKKVTKEEIINLTKKLDLDLIYLLRGEMK